MGILKKIYAKYQYKKGIKKANNQLESGMKLLIKNEKRIEEMKKLIEEDQKSRV